VAPVVTTAALVVVATPCTANFSGAVLVSGGETDVAESGNTSGEREVVLGGESALRRPGVSVGSSQLVLEHAVALGVASERVIGERDAGPDAHEGATDAEVVLVVSVFFADCVMAPVASTAGLIVHATFANSGAGVLVSGAEADVAKAHDVGIHAEVVSSVSGFEADIAEAIDASGEGEVVFRSVHNV